MVYIVFHEEGNCGCDLDPYDYHILGIFNTQDEANQCEEENNKRIDEIKEREEAQDQKIKALCDNLENTDLTPQQKQEEYDKIYNEKEEFYMHYKTFIIQVDIPFTPVKGETVYIVIQSDEKGKNFEEVKGVFQTEEEANLILQEDMFVYSILV